MSNWNMGVYRPRPKGDYDDTTEYSYLDIVKYNGSSYINCNLDTIDGVASIGIAPEGHADSELHWQCIASKGDKGDLADTYLPYEEITNGEWDYSVSDKIFIPENSSVSSINITNVYNGCCGIIISRKDLTMPVNSYYSLDYNYCNITRNTEYYFYTFTYTDFGSNSYAFVWHRTIINRNVG